MHYGQKDRRTALCVAVGSFAAGCQFIRIEEGERTPLEYTIVKQEEIPEEISELMEQKKKKVFQMTYQVGDIRYLMKGIWRAAYRRVQYSGGGGFRIRERSILQDKADRSGESGCRQ